MDTWNLEYVSRGLSTHETVLLDTSSYIFYALSIGMRFYHLIYNNFRI